MFQALNALRGAAATLLLMAGLQAPAFATEPAKDKGNDKDSSFSAGVSIRPEAGPEELGLPFYPGAVPFKDRGESHAGASIGAWGGPFGLQVHAIKLRSRQPVESVALWYREAMARQGQVLDCSQAPSSDPPPLPDKQADKEVLRCGDDRPKAGGALYKQGTRKHLRVVALEPMPGGTRISLVRVEVRGNN